MLSEVSYQSFENYVGSKDNKKDRASFGGIEGVLSLRRRTVVKTVKEQVTETERNDLDDLIEVHVAAPTLYPKEIITQKQYSRFFMEFKPQSAPAEFKSELAKWTAINALVGNLFASTLRTFAPKALPAVAKALGGPGLVVLSVLMPVILGVIKTAIVMRCKAQKGEEIDERLSQEIRTQLETARDRLQKNKRNEWIGAWLGNAIPDLATNILAAVGQQETASQMMEILQPNLASIVKAAIGYGIASKLTTEEPKAMVIPMAKLKFA